jgi:hypothetical protein
MASENRHSQISNLNHWMTRNGDDAINNRNHQSKIAIKNQEVTFQS